MSEAGCSGSPAARLSLLLALLFLLAGCATREPPRAAMVAQSITGDYGYTEKMLAPGRYQVTYVSPRLRARRAAADDHGLAAERQRVHDLALWRAAQLAQEKGYPAFKVEQESRDVDVTVSHDLYYPPPLFGPYRRWWGPYGYWTGYYYDPWYYRSYYRTRSVGRITVNLTVAMLPEMADGALDTAATVDRLRKAYGSATFEANQATGAGY